MRKKSQTGSILAIFAIVVTFTLIGLVSWVLWQNFSVREQPIDPGYNGEKINYKQEEKASPELTDQIYNGETFTFKYPKDGWKISDTTDYLGKTVARVITTDLKFNEVGYTELPAQGAMITVTTTEIEKAGVFKKPSTQDAYGISDIQQLEVDGRVAYFNRMAYEGIYYYVHFQSDRLDYGIRLTAGGDDATRAQKDVFNQVWKTFDIK